MQKAPEVEAFARRILLLTNGYDEFGCHYFAVVYHVYLTV